MSTYTVYFLILERTLARSNIAAVKYQMHSVQYLGALSTSGVHFQVVCISISRMLFKHVSIFNRWF